MTYPTPTAHKGRFNPREVAEMLGVSNASLCHWRRPARLRLGEADPYYLPATPDPDNKNVVWYEWDILWAFIQRHPKYQERLLSAFAPDDVRNAITPSPQPSGQPAQPTKPLYGLLAGLTAPN